MTSRPRIGGSPEAVDKFEISAELMVHAWTDTIDNGPSVPEQPFLRVDTRPQSLEKYRVCRAELILWA